LRKRKAESGKPKAEKYDKLRVALEEYYLSELGTDIATHQKSYAVAIKSINGLSPEENTDVYSSVVEGYLFGRVDAGRAAAEVGVDVEKLKLMLKASGNASALVLLAGSTISREAWEHAFPYVMTATAYSWDGVVLPVEQRPKPEVAQSKPEPEPVQRQSPANQFRPPQPIRRNR
jgi:hypothetical protein